MSSESTSRTKMLERARTAAEAIAERFDNWANAITYLGTNADKTAYTKFIRRFAKNEHELDALFDFDDMANVIVTAEPEAALRKGFTVKLETPEATTAVHEELQRIGLRDALLEALVWENVHGGAAIFLGANDGRTTEKPLDLDNVVSLNFVYTIDCRDLVPCDYYEEAMTPLFGRPKTYTFNGTRRREGGKRTIETAIIHESRLILFKGAMCSTELRREKQGWGASRLDRAYKALQIFADNWSSVSHIMSDAAQGVFTMKGLIRMLSGPQRNVALERMRQVDRQRSVARALILDGDEEAFERKDTTMSGLPDLLDRTSHRLAAAARMPVAVLMGREPSGLNATGEMDMRAWYDQVATNQTHKIAPKIRQAVLVMTSAKQGPTRGVRAEKIEIVFPPPWTATPAERAQIELTHAQADQTRIVSQVATAEQIAVARFRPEGYQDSINLDTKHMEAALEVMLSEAAKGGELPPAPVVPVDDEP